MCVEEPAVLAAWKGAAPIAGFERLADRGRNRARLPADRERDSIAFDDLNDRRVAGQPFCGLRGKRNAILE